MTTHDRWAPIRQGSISGLISERILDVIANEEMHPGDRLPPERELASMLGVGRPALREALGVLKAQRKVDVRHGVGVFVADPPTTSELRASFYQNDLDIEELFGMREVLELPAAEWAAKNRNEEKLLDLKAVYESMDEASRAPHVDWKHLEELDASFHLHIVEAAGNRFLISTQGVLQEILSEGMETTLGLPGRLERSRSDHQRIFEAILSGDPQAARRAAKAHIVGARKAALARRQQDLGDLLNDVH